jgi:hypothetical protein
MRDIANAGMPDLWAAMHGPPVIRLISRSRPGRLEGTVDPREMGDRREMGQLIVSCPDDIET